jgi:hypothetical protein
MAFNMQDTRVYDLKKKISSLEWDLNMISNTEMRTRKEAQLTALRSELNGLLKRAG